MDPQKHHVGYSCIAMQVSAALPCTEADCLKDAFMRSLCKADAFAVCTKLQRHQNMDEESFPGQLL